MQYSVSYFMINDSYFISENEFLMSPVMGCEQPFSFMNNIISKTTKYLTDERLDQCVHIKTKKLKMVLKNYSNKAMTNISLLTDIVKEI